MKIALVAQPYDQIVPPVDYGSSVSIITYQLAHRLARTNEVWIYARKAPFQSKTHIEKEGIFIRGISGSAAFLFKLIDRVSGMCNFKRPFFSTRLYYLPYILQVAHDIRKQNFDIVHLHSHAQYVPMIRAQNPKAKIVLQMHGESLIQLDYDTICRQIAEADLILGVSDFITEGIRKRFPQFSNRCKTLYNGVDIGLFKESKKEPNPDKYKLKRILYVGRVSPEKGIHILIDAFKKVFQVSPDVYLEIVGGAGLLPAAFLIGINKDPRIAELARFYGDGIIEKISKQIINNRSSYLDELKRNIPTEIAKHIFFRGQVPHSKLVDYYRNADIVVLPTVFNEPCPVPIIEAMSCGIPVISTLGGGPSELIENGKSGFLVESGNSQALAEALLKVIKSSNLKMSMGKTGRKRAVDLFSWEKLARRLESYYQTL